MPQRSNPFQRLALFVHKALEPEWKVVESAMLTDSVTGAAREVDIVATRSAAGHELVLSIECRDHSRAADVQWIESAATKHAHLPTSKLVLWSRSGFTKQATLKAKALKIDTISQADATSPTWARLARELVGGHAEHVAPKYKAFVDLILPDGQLERFETVDDWNFFDADGALVGSVAAFVSTLAHHPETGETLLNNASPGLSEFWAELVPPEPWFAEHPLTGRCQAHRIGVGITAQRERAPLKTASAVNGDKVLTLVSADLKSGTIEVVVEESKDAPARFRRQDTGGQT